MAEREKSQTKFNIYLPLKRKESIMALKVKAVERKINFTKNGNAPGYIAT